MLKTVAAGQGEDMGLTLQFLASISLKMIKVLQEAAGDRESARGDENVSHGG